MNEIPKNPILCFNSNQIVKVRDLYNYNDLSRLNQDIKILEDWIHKQNHFFVREYDKEYLERFIINCKGSIERAKKYLDKICTLRGLMPDYLQGFDVKNEFNHLLKVVEISILPKPTPDNYRVMFVCLKDPDAYEACMSKQCSRYFTVILEYLNIHDYCVGLEVIVDTSKLSLNVITKLNPVTVANSLMLLLYGRGLRMKGFHLMSGSKFMDALVAILKQGLTKKLLPRLHVHDNLESLYNLVSREILPKNYGGDEDCLEDICANVFKEMSSDEHIQRMKFIETATTDESQRLRSHFNEEYSGMPGSFKVLSVD